MKIMKKVVKFAVCVGILLSLSGCARPEASGLKESLEGIGELVPKGADGTGGVRNISPKGLLGTSTLAMLSLRRKIYGDVNRPVYTGPGYREPARQEVYAVIRKSVIRTSVRKTEADEGHLLPLSLGGRDRGANVVEGAFYGADGTRGMHDIERCIMHYLSMVPEGKVYYYASVRSVANQPRSIIVCAVTGFNRVLLLSECRTA